MKEITEDYVSFETAKLLKEKGFDEDIDLWYDENGEMFIHPKYDIGRNWRVRQGLKIYQCSTLQMAMKWLRVTYGYYIWVDYSRFDFDKNQPFLWNVVKAEIDGDYYGGTYHKTYEKACEAAIKYVLENLV